MQVWQHIQPPACLSVLRIGLLQEALHQVPLLFHDTRMVIFCPHSQFQPHLLASLELLHYSGLRQVTGLLISMKRIMVLYSFTS